MKVYTKTGDKGTTSLIGGERVSKTNIRLDAYGTVDELSAHVAFLRDSIDENDKLNHDDFTVELKELREILHRLMIVSTALAADSSMYEKLPKITEGDILVIEKSIDRISEMLIPIERFTLPGGNTTISASHIARTVCRRAERESLRASEQFDIDVLSVMYLNRLSDYLYVLGRKITQNLNIEELYWDGGAAL